ncbi:MAG: XcyI family restriction endonuclease [Rhodothermaceae bacterium]|nr:XcyI family restriction endonuclease [Rhodothermaceae bacterium]MYE61969.1 XcyI family restriction endonuclease [Rhodothermaceae bacterium]
MTTTDDNLRRSRFLSYRIRQRTDIKTRNIIEGFSGKLDYWDKTAFMISDKAWDYVKGSGIDPCLVFAHPDLLHEHPQTSLYYRGLSLLSQKRVAQAATSIVKWEDGTYKRQPIRENVLAVCRTYNTIISSIIEGTTDWTLDNGYRNIMATIGIGLDGSWSNKIGKDAESMVQDLITRWLRNEDLIMAEITSKVFELSGGVRLTFGSEPDVSFEKNGTYVATIEVKGGKDPAGALERLGAVQKSFAETPVQCQNFLIAGVVTSEMHKRLNELPIKEVFLLDDLLSDAGWEKFATEVFHHALRIT